VGKREGKILNNLPKLFIKTHHPFATKAQIKLNIIAVSFLEPEHNLLIFNAEHS